MLSLSANVWYGVVMRRILRGYTATDAFKITAPHQVAIHFGGLTLMDALLLLPGIEEALALPPC